MKLRMHHIELCVTDPNPVSNLFCNQLGLDFVGYRETTQCLQLLFKMERATFVVTTRNQYIRNGGNNYPQILFDSGTLQESDLDQKAQKLTKDPSDAWTLFCCDDNGSKENHIDSVFNVVIEVEHIRETVNNIRKMSNDLVLQDVNRVYDYGAPDMSKLGYVDYAIIKSCCGNVVHTLVEKKGYSGWFLPGFHKANRNKTEGSASSPHNIGIINMTHFDHFTLACRVGESIEIMDWYERAFGMKRFMTNREDTELEGLVIGDDVGLRLKVMQFWKCSESGLASVDAENGGEGEPLKIVIAESLPNISNTQIEGFIKDHGGPGIQHVGLHTDNMIKAVEIMTKNGINFQHPPPTYYTEVGQLEVIKTVGEDVEILRKYGILLDNEADVFDNLENDYHHQEERYLMQIFTYPVFGKDTFFLEVIQRKGARGFGVGNVTALARSVNAFQKAKLEMELEKMRENNNKPLVNQ